MTDILDTQAALHPILRERWSPRSFTPVHDMPERDLDTLMEAARWSPSANNIQPWRYIVAQRGTDVFNAISGSLSRGNHAWAPNASVLIVGLAKTIQDDGSYNPYATYDLGQSIAHLSIQAHAMGYHAHQMGGFNAEQIREEFGLSSDLLPFVVVAIGEVADPDLLPEMYREREMQPRVRKDLSEIVLNRE